MLDTRVFYYLLIKYVPTETLKFREKTWSKEWKKDAEGLMYDWVTHFQYSDDYHIAPISNTFV